MDALMRRRFTALHRVSLWLAALALAWSAVLIPSDEATAELMPAPTTSTGAAAAVQWTPARANAGRTFRDVAWTVQFGTAQRDWAQALAFDAGEQRLVVAGTTEGALMGEAAGSFDTWVAALAPDSGEQLTADQFGSSGTDSLAAMDVDADGRVVFAGHVNRVANGRSTDYWGRVLAPDLATLVDYEDGTTAYDAALGLTALNNAYVIGGHTTGALDPAVAPTGNDIFLRRYDELDDEESWTRQFSLDDNDQLTAVTDDGSENIYATGFTAPVGFSRVATRAWVVRYTADGEELDRAFINVPIDLPSDATITHRGTGLTTLSGVLYVAGYTTIDALERPFVQTGWLAKFSGDLDDPDWIRLLPGSTAVSITDLVGDPNSGQLYLTGTGMPDGTTGAGASWLAAYSQEGERLWMQQVGNETTRTAAVAVDLSGALYIAGSVDGDLDGDGPGQHSAGDDAFIQKLEEPLPEYVIEVMAGDWIVDGIEVGPGDLATVDVDSILEHNCIVGAETHEASQPGARCEAALRLSRACVDRAHYLGRGWLWMAFNGWISPSKREFARVLVIHLHALALACDEADLSAATVAPLSSIELEIDAGSVDLGAMSQPLLLQISSGENAISTYAPFAVQAGHGPESGLTGVTSYSGEVHIIPAYDELDSMFLSSGQAITVTAEALGEVNLLKQTFLPTIWR